MRHVSQNETILAGFLPWVEMQSGEYPYLDADECAIGTYLAAIGRPLGSGSTALSQGQIINMFGLGVAKAVIGWPWTYEALASRLRAIADADRKMADANMELERGSA